MIARVFALGAAVALLSAPALAGWDTSRMSGPWLDPADMTTVIFVLPASQVTADLQPYAEPVPAGVPVLDGVPSEALAFPDLATAQTALAAYWTPDTPNP